jgi:hypothetical protein
MDAMASTDTPDEAVRAAVTARINAHVAAGWPHLQPVVEHRGKFCYVGATSSRGLRRRRAPFPILRLRYAGSPDHWKIGIYLASKETYTEAELPTSFGPRTGTPEQGIDHTFILYAGPRRNH